MPGPYPRESEDDHEYDDYDEFSDEGFVDGGGFDLDPDAEPFDEFGA